MSVYANNPSIICTVLFRITFDNNICLSQEDINAQCHMFYVFTCPVHITVIVITALSLSITISAITTPESVTNPSNLGSVSDHL